MAGRCEKVFIFIGKLLCSFVFFLIFFNRTAVAFFALWCVSVFNETCRLILKATLLCQKLFLVLYDYPRCNTCSLSEWLCSRRSRMMCDPLFFFICTLTCSYNCCWQPFKLFILTLPFRTRWHLAFFYVSQFHFMFNSFSFRKVQTTSVAA